MQKWKIDSSLHSCERKDGKKVLDYHTTYVKEFLEADPLRDWESIERCKDLWFWSSEKSKWENIDEWSVLDAGSKDGQFPEFLEPIVEKAIGIEISSDYIKYAQDKDRPVIYGNICELSEEWTDKFDCVFSHHLLGLTSDINKAISEMYRVTKSGGYIISCTDVPGNPKKHYSLINDSKIFDDFIIDNDVEILYNGYWNEEFPKEWVFFIQKNEVKNV